MVGTPIANPDASGRPATLDHEGFQRPIAVDVSAFQIVSWCPRISVIGAVRDQDAEGHVVFRNGKLDDLVRAHLLEVQRHGWIELARVADFSRDRAMRQIGLFDPDVHIESLVGFIAVTEQGPGSVAQHPVSDVFPVRIGSDQGH